MHHHSAHTGHNDMCGLLFMFWHSELEIVVWWAIAYQLYQCLQIQILASYCGNLEEQKIDCIR